MTRTTKSSVQQGLGIDVGGSGIKGALVDLNTGEFLSERIRIDTPKPATVDAVMGTIATLVERFCWEGSVGIALPSVIRQQTAHTAANIDSSWIGTDLQAAVDHHLPGHAFAALNDADAAGVAEIAFGHPQARQGSVLFLTFGTGIGSALFIDGKLFPNTELGHQQIPLPSSEDSPCRHVEAELWASSAAKVREELSFKKWARRVDEVLHEYEKLLNPDLFVVGGGISRKHEKWIPRLSVKTPVVPAQLRNKAGIVGAAMAAAHNITP